MMRQREWKARLVVTAGLFLLLLFYVLCAKEPGKNSLQSWIREEHTLNAGMEYFCGLLSDQLERKR